MVAEGSCWRRARGQPFAAYERTGKQRYVGGFAVGDTADGTVDGVQHSDGAALVTTPLGGSFPGGLLVLHDGEDSPEQLDEDGEPRVGTDLRSCGGTRCRRSAEALTARQPATPPPGATRVAGSLSVRPDVAGDSDHR